MTRFDENECPRESEALAYASGTLPEDAIPAVEAHLSECASCRETVAVMAGMVLPDETPAEVDVAAKLEAASRDGVRDLLDERLGPPRDEGGTVVAFPVQEPVRPKMWWTAAAAALAVALGGVIFWQRTHEPNLALMQGNTAIELALREGRPFEYRLSGMEYAPYEAVRSGGPSDRKELLDAARVSLAAAVADEPTPETRQAYGRALVASGDCKAAVVQLQDASDASPNDVATHIDLAIALACEGHDTFAAQKHLDLALAREPSNPEALFNRAILAKRVGDLAAARSYFEAYLKADPTSPWAAEARRGLEDTK
jgi:hypothetical protein